MNGIDQELFELFIAEAKELLDAMFRGMEQLPSIAIEARPEPLRVFLRKTHNLKGSSAPIGVEKISEICHEIEELLSPYRESTSPIPDDTFATINRHLVVLDKLVSTVSTQFSEAKKREAAEAFANITVDSNGTMRIATSRLDKLLSYSGELLSSQARMSDHNHKLQKFIDELQQAVVACNEMSHIMNPLQSAARKILQESRNGLLDFGHLINGINTSFKKLRMVPLKTAEPEWRQIVRNAAQKENKEVSLQVVSSNVELDKHVLAQLKDPMTHILRNAVSHGIEDSDIRKQLGKSPKGTIIVGAKIVGANVQLHIQDDGAGIDMERVLQTAVSKNLIDLETQTVEHNDIVDILFQPGFSTAENVSSVSGRGVGLDVVCQRIQALGGNVSIYHSEENVGTTFLLSVPLNILSSLGLFVVSCGTTYAISVDDIVRAFRVHKGNISSVDGVPMAATDNDAPVRLIFLSDIIRKKHARKKHARKKHAAVGSSHPSDSWFNVVVLERNDVQIGLVVDRVEEQQEYVVGRLPWNLVNVPGVNGSIIRPDGKLAVSLDVRYLFSLTQRLTNSISPTSSHELSNTQLSIHRILVVDDSAAARALGKKLLEDGGFYVATAADGQEAIEILQEHSFDLVVSDVDMPRVDGLELTRHIRRTSQLHDLPVILVTSRSSDKERAEGAAAGADEYVIKGRFNQRFLLDLVSKYL